MKYHALTTKLGFNNVGVVLFKMLSVLISFGVSAPV
jgi:hypothetical protein